MYLICDKCLRVSRSEHRVEGSICNRTETPGSTRICNGIPRQALATRDESGNILVVAADGRVGQNWPVTIGRERENYTQVGKAPVRDGDYVYSPQHGKFGVVEEIGRAASGRMILHVFFLTRSSADPTPGTWVYPENLDKAFFKGV